MDDILLGNYYQFWNDHKPSSCYRSTRYQRRGKKPLNCGAYRFNCLRDLRVRLVHCFPELDLSWASSPAPAMLCLARLIIWLETNKTNCCSKDFFGQPCDSCSYFVRWDRRLGLLLKERNWLSFKSEVSVAWRGALAPGSEKFLEVPIARIVQFLPRIQTHKKYHHWTFQTFTQINASCQF